MHSCLSESNTNMFIIFVFQYKLLSIVVVGIVNKNCKNTFSFIAVYFVTFLVNFDAGCKSTKKKTRNIHEYVVVFTNTINL